MKSKEEVRRRLRCHIAGTIALGSAKFHTAHTGGLKTPTVQSYGEIMIDLNETTDALIDLIYDFITAEEKEKELCQNPPRTGVNSPNNTPPNTRKT